MSGSAGRDAAPSLAEVERIAVLGDPVLRNLLITQSYADLSRALTRRTGASANWCTFAAWASKQAGQTIRQEDLHDAWENLAGNSPTVRQAAANLARAAQQLGARQDVAEITRTAWAILDPRAALDRASTAVARGNQKVFAEIGREFARFTANCLPDEAPRPAGLDSFCAALRPGLPPEGQDYLRQAFTSYYQACFEPDAKQRAELILLANLAIGCHEQTRLQPEIAAALDAAVAEPDPLIRRLLTTLLPYHGWLVYAAVVVLRRLRGRTLLDIAAGRFIAAVRRQVRALLTAHLMVIGLADGNQVRLGQDLRASFPAALRQLSNPELLALLARIDPTPDSPRASGATDWANLPERLHFIADLFRSCQEAPQVLQAPFTPDQTAAIRAGRRPPGPL
ncbi:MAG: hypothetical protein IT318_03955 [Anaerolineales bacterium]|nr:hypothetical protein [Anaerolineales bacterium]